MKFWNRSLAALGMLFLTATGGLIWYIWSTLQTGIEHTALSNAANHTAAIREFRSAYTSEIVANVHDKVKVTHDYEAREDSIPLPATLSMMVGNRIARGETGGRIRLYSPYPFPWRKQEGGLNDQFEKQAWSRLQENPDEPYYSFETVDGRPMLRYATADTMRSSCVNCHNNHAQTPRVGWKAGDVRGILEVDIPMDVAYQEAQSAQSELVLIIGGVLMLGVLTISVAVYREKTRSAFVETRVAQLNEDLDRSRGVIETLSRRNEENQQLQEELQFYSEIAGGREDRMIALKQEVNGLSQRLGEAAPYELATREREGAAV